MSAEHDASAYAPESPGRPPVLYEVTAVDTEAGTCTVKPVYDPAQALVDAGERDDVVFLTASAPSAGATGMLLTLSNGNVVFFAGGGGAGASQLARADADMTADSTAYDCYLLNADGSDGAATTACRPPDVYVKDGAVGSLLVDEAGVTIFMPGSSYVEVRPADPSSPISGRIWIVE